MRTATAAALSLVAGILAVHASSPSDAVVCDCGFQDEAGRIWAEVWHADYNTYQAKLANDKNYVVMNYTVPPKYTNTLARMFDPANVQMQDGLELAVRKQSDGSFTSASLGTKRQDFLYGTFRASMRMTSVPGTVQAFFFFRNNTCEIDMESVSRIQNPWKTYLTVQPQVYNEDGSASNVTNRKHVLDFDPVTDFYEYRFDWLPEEITYYINGLEADRIQQNVPQSPGRVLINHWTDGNPNFSGLPEQDAFLNVANMTFFFNSSEATAPPPCQKTQSPCSVSDIMNQHLMPASTTHAPQSSPGSGQEAAAAVCLLPHRRHALTAFLYSLALYILSSVISA